MEKVVGLFLTDIEPPWLSIIVFAIFKPNPVPSVFVVYKDEGTGLGLKMAKTIIDSHGGSISVRNNPTTFSIKLPKN